MRRALPGYTSGDMADVDRGREPTMIDPLRADTARVPLRPAGREASRDVIAGRYALGERIGRGGMGEVWRAHDRTLQRDVAVKLLHDHLADDADARERFAAEATRSARLTHPRVVRILDAGEDGDDAFLVMELIDGASLDEVIGAPLGSDVVRQLGIDLAEALAAAHAAGIVHRDVKPSNVLLAADGARLSDFGVARAVDETSRTAPGQLLGTAAYLSPEQAQGGDASPASDVYALGCVLYEAATGRRRYDGEGPLQVALARVGADTPVDDLTPHVDVDLARAIVALLHPDPTVRPADGAAAAALLDAGGGPAARQPAPVAGSSVAGAPAPAPRPVPPAGEGDDDPTLAPRGGAPAGVAERPGGRRAWWVLALLGVVAAVVIGLAALEGADDTGGAGAPAVGDAAPAAPVTAQLTSFDPAGGGAEHEDEVPLLTDGDPATAWTTEGYDTAAFGNLKPGVGILVDLGQPVAVAEVRLDGMAAGQDLQLRTAESRPTGIDATTEVAAVTDAGAAASLTPPEPITTRWLVVWLTGELPAGDGRFRGQVGELEVVPG